MSRLHKSLCCILTICVMSGCAHEPIYENEAFKTTEERDHYFKIDADHCLREMQSKQWVPIGHLPSSTTVTEQQADQRLCIARLGWVLK